MDQTAGSEAFIDDAEHHNAWWNDGTSRNLETAMELPSRSDLHQLLKAIDGGRSDGTDSLVYPIYGQTGVGKTTLLYQFIGAIMETTEFEPGGRDFDILSAVSPRQILYVPLEAGLYHLERAEDAIQQVQSVIDYFQSHVAQWDERQYIILDDIGTLDLDAEGKRALLDYVDEETYLLLTGIVASQVDVREIANEDTEAYYPRSVLTVKFIDFLKHSTHERGPSVPIGDDLAERIGRFQSSTLDGPHPIKTARHAFGTGDGDADTAVSLLEELYFDYFSSSERHTLHDAATEYLRSGGAFYQSERADVRNELVKSHYLLYLYKEIADYKSIQQPEHLHRLASLAASHAGEELQYTDISDRLAVDRRTVDGYLDALDEGIAVTESQEYSLRRHRRTRLYLRNPRHVVLLSRRAEHYGFEQDDEAPLNRDFEYKLARTVAYDHAMRLAFSIGAYDVEYCETDGGTVDYILQRKETVYPFVLSYHPHGANAESIALAFDPSSGQHAKSDSEELYEYEYNAPYHFILTDSMPRDLLDDETLVRERDNTRLCYVPFWLFLLIC